MLMTCNRFKVFGVDTRLLTTPMMDEVAVGDRPLSFFVRCSMSHVSLGSAKCHTSVARDVAVLAPDPARRDVAAIFGFPTIGGKNGAGACASMTAPEAHRLPSSMSKLEAALNCDRGRKATTALTDSSRVGRVRKRRLQSQMLGIHADRVATHMRNFVRWLQRPDGAFIGHAVGELAWITESSLAIPTEAPYKRPAFILQPLDIAQVELIALQPGVVTGKKAARRTPHLAASFVRDLDDRGLLAAAALAVAVRDRLFGHIASLSEVVFGERGLSWLRSPHHINPGLSSNCLVALKGGG